MSSLQSYSWQQVRRLTLHEYQSQSILREVSQRLGFGVDMWSDNVLVRASCTKGRGCQHEC